MASMASQVGQTGSRVVKELWVGMQPHPEQHIEAWSTQMQHETTADPADPNRPDGRKGVPDVREFVRNVALRNALQKRSAGVPTYSVPETAALLGISQEYLYRLIHAGGFPAIGMRIAGRQGRYVVPAKAVEQLLDHAVTAGSCVEVSEWTKTWQGTTAGGAA